MTIGIIFCGGCNTRYDRGQLAQHIIAALPEHTFIYNSLACDLVIYLSGCTSNCARKHNSTNLPYIYLDGTHIDTRKHEHSNILQSILGKIPQQ